MLKTTAKIASKKITSHAHKLANAVQDKFYFFHKAEIPVEMKK